MKRNELKAFIKTVLKETFLAQPEHSDDWEAMDSDEFQHLKGNPSKPDPKDDVPFDFHPKNEGYGMGDMNKDPKQAHKGAKWTVKFDEDTAPSANNDLIIKSMKDWIKDCLPWRDLESEEDVDELTPEQVMAGIEKNYDGGLKAFYRDFQYSSKQSKSSLNEGIRPLYESKGKTVHEKLKNMILESIQEMKEDKNTQLAKEVIQLSNKLFGEQQLDPHIKAVVLKLKKLAESILKSKSEELKTDDIEKTALGVTQETISKTKNVLDQMISSRKKK